MFAASFGSATKKPIVVTVHPRSKDSGISMLVLKTDDHEGDFTIFYNDANALDQILDLGYEIVAACRKLMPAEPITHQPIEEAPVEIYSVPEAFKRMVPSNLIDGP